MSSGNNTNSGNNGNGADKIDWQRATMPNLIERVEDLLEVQIAKFNEQLHCRCEKLMKQVAEQEEEARKLAEEEAKKKTEEDTQKRAEFQSWWKADSERKAREKAEAKAVAEVMRAQIAQKVGQGKKRKESEITKEIEEALGGFSVAGPSTWPDPVMQVLDQRLGEVIVAIDRNTRELAWLGGKMDRFMWEMKRMADHSDQKGKGRAQPEEAKEEEEKSDNMSDADAEGEDVDE
ncbi:hypothetical protein SCLCIDRAFT_23905 [Scleroderma citrinum Foug A]|uniref:Uncharacterized protein n=1 Tax=Scleroderma citrinum Foug A TaxID=1036808 RepID=A0A0C3AFM4_9AGAM|nr:hypothetical protein SCLCIDRAFT_23905 [Scleroderma citrinum Foug A]